MNSKDKRYHTPVGAGLPAMLITLFAFALLAGASTLAQVGTDQSQGYQLRANIAMASSIAPETAKRYGISRGPKDALVDVVVVRSGGQYETVPASVKVHASNLTGQTLVVKMHAISEAGRVSYLGVYKFEPDEVVDFDVVARLENSTEELHARVREHFPPG
jgi:threonine dehydrogenase-like Zn-dependent dehydrogenase